MKDHVCNHEENTPEPAVYSKKYEITMQEEVKTELIQQGLTSLIKELQNWAKKSGCFIGHIKIFVEGPETLWLSSTGKSIHIKQSMGWQTITLKKISLNITAIVFGISKIDLEEIVKQKVEKCIKDKVLVDFWDTGSRIQLFQSGGNVLMRISI